MIRPCTKVIIPEQARLTCSLGEEWKLSRGGHGLVHSVRVGLFQVRVGKPRRYLYSDFCILGDLCYLLFLQDSEVLSMSGMESFIEKQTKLLRIQPAEVPDKDPQQVPKEYVDSGLLDKAVVAQELNKSGPGE